MQKFIMLITLGCTIFAMILITVIFHVTSTEQIRRDSISSNMEFLERLENELNSQIHRLTIKLQTIYAETSLASNMKNRQESGANLKNFYWTAGKFVESRFTNTDELEALYIYDSTDSFVSNYRTNVVNFVRDIYEEKDETNAGKVLDYIGSEETGILLSGYYNTREKANIVRMVMKLHDYNVDRREYGYIVCDFNSHLFNEIISKYVPKNTLVWIQPEGDVPIATLMGNDRGMSWFEELSSQIRDTQEMPVFREEYGEFYLCSRYLDTYRLHIVMLLPKSLALATQRTLLQTLIMVSGLMLIIIVLASMVLAGFFSRPVQEMMETIVRIREGDLSLRVKPVGWSEELELLGTEFNDLLDQIQNMITEKYESELLIKRTQYQALQAQVNPHFLYNTLDTMSGIANSQNCYLVSGLCQSLSSIFRYSLDISDKLSTVEKELVHVRNYLYVMDIRTGYSTSHTIEVDDDVMDDKIPRITLQPIVENAISHGLRSSKKDSKCIWIRGYHRDGNLLIEIRDNGVGMDAAKINEDLRRNSLERVETGNSIGILNVNARIEKAFGADYGLSVESVENEGTTVTITLPIRKEDEIESEKL